MLFPTQTPPLCVGFAELVKSFHTRVVAAVRPGTCPALVNGTSRFVATLVNERLISEASIAARTILIEPLYGGFLMENKNLAYRKRVEKFFMMNFFLTFSILLQSLVSRRI